VLEALFDAGTIRHLEAVGVQPGWRCLELGGGGGSIAAWLARRVGAGGAVVATDLDVTFLAELGEPNLEVHRLDVEAADPPAGPFDLVHLRFLLAWLRDPQAALRRIVAALKPGGLLLAEEMDFVSVVPDPRADPETVALFTRVQNAKAAGVATAHGLDPFHGRRLAADLVAAGLTDVGSEGRCATWWGGTPGGTFERLSLVQLREAAVATGLASAADVERAISLYEDPGFSFLSPTAMAAWGRRAR
jgi:SAM-dependent methyltransferase